MLSSNDSSLDSEDYLSHAFVELESQSGLLSPGAYHTPIGIRSRFVGERLNLKTLEAAAPLASNPLLVGAGQNGCAVLFRYGVAVFFNVSSLEEAAFLESLKSFISEPSQTLVSEQIEIAFETDAKERIERNILWLNDSSFERLQVVADIFAKTVILEYYENQISDLFERIRPFADAIQNRGVRRPKDRELLRQIGGTLLIQHKMVGIVEVGEKPDPLWERPDLERLYVRLEDEYELRERFVALERKLALVSRTAETALELMQQESSQRVEWYIVALIVVEILLSLYQLWINSK
jgi:required for meiotic nuclear division protein 1